MTEDSKDGGLSDGVDATDEITVDDLVWFAFGQFVDGQLDVVEQLAAAASSTFGDLADELARVPEPLRADKARARAWVEFVMTLAQMLNSVGETRLTDRLFSADDNPFERWTAGMGEAHRLRVDGRFAESDAVLADVLVELRTSQGTGVDELLGKALGMAAANAFDLGRLDDAVRITDEALRECERTGDADGVATYSANLATVNALLTANGPHRQIRTRLSRAQQLHDSGRLAEALALATETVQDLEAIDAPDLTAAYGAKAHGLLGMVCYRRGDLVRARAHTATALDLGRRHSDRDAIAVYEANLAVMDAERASG